jgi:hypothetical protein
VVCDVLEDDQRCPSCGAAPRGYELGGECYCWLHRERMVIRWSLFSLFGTVASCWREHAHLFPNAKVLNGGTETKRCSEVQFCESCQRAFEEFLVTGSKK